MKFSGRISVRRKLIVAIMTVHLLLVFTGAFDLVDMAEESPLEIKLTQEEKTYLEEHQVFTYAIATDYVPIEYLDKKGQPHGVGVTYLDYASELLGVEFQLVDKQETYTWEDNLELMKAGEIDLLPTATLTQDRKEYMDFTMPYYAENMIVVGRMGSEVVFSIEDLNAKKLCFAKGHWQVEYFGHRLSQPLIYEAPTIGDVLKMIHKGDMEYTLVDENVYVHYLQNNNLDELYSLGYINLNAEHRMAFSKDHAILCTIMEKVIQSVPKSEVYKKAFSMESVAEAKRRSFLINATTIVILSLLAAAFAISRLRHMHYKRKMLDSRTALIENLSHDLKTPLSTLRANIGLMKSGIVPADQQNTYYSKLDNNIDRMNSIIEDLYHISGLNELNDDSTKEYINMRPWIFDIYQVHKVRFLEQSKDLHFSCEMDEWDDCTMSVKKGMMERAVENLLSNALKFSSDLSHTHLTLKASRGEVEITVANHGEGIDPSEQRLIFERFYQSKVDHLNPGKGLGLSIADEIVRSHGGRITVESKPKGITKFSIVLPR